VSTSSPGSKPPSGHYSYTVYADPVHAGRFDTLRFSGPIGTLVAEAQEQVILSFLPDLVGASVLDVGTGTGRGAISLARRGARVTGIDASTQMLDLARQRARDESLSIEFTQGDAHRLDFEDGSFDVAVSLRVLMHTPDWRRCLAELCRVARERVLFDYPALASAAALQAGGRRVAAAFGARTEAYRVLGARTVRRELARNGFRVEAEHRQFVLPIALHKAIGSRAVTLGLERALKSVGLLRMFGSPVTVAATRERRR
jgi:ubiquinone/menaquinone biosynthesis C-methylase UbiE